MGKSFQHSFEVCTCKHVTLGEMIYAIKEQKAQTLQDIENITDAGSACGCCANKEKDFGNIKKELYIEEILNKFRK